MKNASITGIYTTPFHEFELSSVLKRFLIDEIEKILAKYEFPNLKAQELEILINTQIESDTTYLAKNRSTQKGYYLSYTFWMPYSKIVQDEKTDLAVFLDEFFGGLIQVLTPLGVNESEILEAQNIAKKEIIGNDKYIYVPCKSTLVLRQYMKQQASIGS